MEQLRTEQSSLLELKRNLDSRLDYLIRRGYGEMAETSRRNISSQLNEVNSRLSQINKIDMSNPELLAESDNKMMININQIAYLKYLFRTVIGKGSGDAMIYKK